MLLESQYKQWLAENPGQYLTDEEWFKQWGEINNLPMDFEPFVSDDFQIGPDGLGEDVITEINRLKSLLNGLEKEQFRF